MANEVLGSSVLPIANGGTGSGTGVAAANGQVYIGRTSDGTFNPATLTGTANQVTITNGGSSITISLPQSIATTSAVAFASVAINSGTVISNLVAGQTAAMTAGSITVSTAKVTAASKILLTHAGTGAGTTHYGVLSVGTITAGTSFVINSADSADTDAVNYLIIN